MKYVLLAALLASFFLSACQPGNPGTSVGDQEPETTFAPGSEETLDATGLVEALESAGATVGQEGEIEQPFFSVPGQVITINGESVQVFEYANVTQADAEATQVAPDGSSIGTTMATWIGPPHFYRAESLIILYVGDDQTIIELFETVLGPQFAGADTSVESDFPSEPSPAILQIGEAEQVSGISGYCWTIPGEDHGICADGIGFGTSPEPLIVESPFVARFISQLSTPPDSLMLSVRTLEPEDKLPDEPGGLYWWRPQSKDQILENLTPPYEVELALDPGLYLFNYFAEWQEYGDVSYGFLVEVTPPAG